MEFPHIPLPGGRSEKRGSDEATFRIFLAQQPIFEEKGKKKGGREQRMGVIFSLLLLFFSLLPPLLTTSMCIVGCPAGERGKKRKEGERKRVATAPRLAWMSVIVGRRRQGKGREEKEKKREKCGANLLYFFLRDRRKGSNRLLLLYFFWCQLRRRRLVVQSKASTRREARDSPSISTVCTFYNAQNYLLEMVSGFKQSNLKFCSCPHLD